MALPGLLVEYLITGSCAVIWIWCLTAAIAPSYVLNVANINAAHATVAVPLSYVAGMVIDYIGRLVATALRYFVADNVNERLAPAIASRLSPKWTLIRRFLCNGEKHGDDLAQAEISYLSAELGHQYEMRSSRDRVARGVFANVVLAAIIGLYFRRSLPPAVATIWPTLSVVFALLTFAVWYRAHSLTELFGRSAAQLLHDKRARGVEIVGS